MALSRTKGPKSPQCAAAWDVVEELCHARAQRRAQQYQYFWEMRFLFKVSFISNLIPRKSPVGKWN